MERSLASTGETSNVSNQQFWHWILKELWQQWIQIPIKTSLGLWWKRNEEYKIKFIPKVCTDHMHFVWGVLTSGDNWKYSRVSVSWTLTLKYRYSKKNFENFHLHFFFLLKKTTDSAWFWSKWVNKFLPAQNLCTYKDIFYSNIT